MHIAYTYAKELERYGYGLPLWYPELPVEGVRIGDVGFVMEGRFHPLFNCTTAADAQQATPDNFQPLTLRQRFIMYNQNAVPAGPLVSRGVRAISIEASSGAPPVTSSGAYGSMDLSFKCEAASGSFLFLYEGAYTTVMLGMRSVRDYIQKNYRSWYDFSQRQGFTTELSDIVFVRGFAKTADDWCLGAVAGGSQPTSAELRLYGGDPEHPRIVTTGSENTGWQHRSSRTIKPPANPNTEQAEGNDGATSPKRHDHTIFLNSYKMRRRLFRQQLKAQAGYPKLPGPGNEDGKPSTQLEYGSPESADVDRCDNVLLDYIFAHCDAEVAIICDSDIESFLVGLEQTNRLRGWLEETKPRIKVDKDQVATLYLEDTVRRLRSHTISALGRANTAPPASPPGRLLSTGKLRLQPAEEGNHLEWPHMHLRDATSKQVSPVAVSVTIDGELLVAAYHDRYIRVWKPCKGRLLHRWYGHGAAILSVAVAPATHLRVASGSADGAIIIWDADSSKALTQLEAHNSAITSLAYSPDGLQLASGAADGTVVLWDTTAHNLAHTLRSHSTSVTHLAFAPALTSDATRLISCADAVGQIWDAYSGALVASLEGHTAPISSMLIVGERVVTGSDDGTCRVWDIDTGVELAAVDCGVGPVSSMALSVNGTQVICGAARGAVTFELKDGKIVHRLGGGADTELSAVRSVACSSLATYAATGSANGSVVLWDMASGSFVGEYMGHEGVVKSVVFSKDGKDLYSSSQDGSIRVWSVTDVLQLVL